MKLPKVYFIPGMGANKDLFANQRNAGFEMEVLEWITPYKGETIEDYSERMSENLNINEDFIIAGVSFGGVIAVEIDKKLKPLKTILISSVPTHQEYPLLLKFFSAFPLYRLTPQTAYSNSLVQKFILYSMGFETDEGKRLFLDMLNATNPVFIQWAIDALMKWKNTTIPQSLIRIHGKADKIFPHRMIKDVHYLHGGHSIIFEDAENVNSIIRLAIESTLVGAYSKI